MSRTDPIRLTFQWKVNDALTNATSVKLSNSAATFGVKRVDTGGVVVADGTDFVNTATGMYEYEFTPTQRGLTYFYYIEIVHGGKTHRIAGVKYDPYPSTLEASDFLAGCQSAFNRSDLTVANITEALTNCLQHLSDEGIHFDAVDTGYCIPSQEYISAPVEYMGMGVFYLLDMLGVQQEPLKVIEGGMKMYREGMAGWSVEAIPTHYTWSLGNFYLYQRPDAAYPYVLHYLRGHPSYDGTIYFPVKFKPLISIGVKYYFAMDLGNEKYIDRWRAPFFDRVRSVRNSIIWEPSFVGA